MGGYDFCFFSGVGKLNIELSYTSQPGSFLEFGRTDQCFPK